MSARPRFITFEGGEGAGKSTQIGLLAEALRDHGEAVTVTREPGGTPGAEAIRALLVSGENDRWEPLAETLLHLAARRQHLAMTIRPALARGDWVLCDRFYDSTRAYQGAAQAVSRATIDALHVPVLEGLEPALTLVLDIAPEAGLLRAGARESASRYEHWSLARHTAIREAFRAIAAAEPERCILIDASRPVDSVAAEVWEAAAARFPELAR